LRRFGTSEDVAYAALYFASDESAFITGAELAVDGGMQATL
jgi:NAD(P)-dependent dehydrogenase (short-subunit alcohol dehydrogenase family)